MNRNQIGNHSEFHDRDGRTITFKSAAVVENNKN